MRLRNEIFAHVLDWLIQNNKVEDQKDLALKTGISQNTVSRIMTGKVEPSDDTLRKLNATFGNIFNMQYLRGESIVMLIEDVAYYKSHPGELNKLINGEGDNKIDQSSLVNAALAAKDETIAALANKFRQKDELIAAFLPPTTRHPFQQQSTPPRMKNYLRISLPKGIADKERQAIRTYDVPYIIMRLTLILASVLQMFYIVN